VAGGTTTQSTRQLGNTEFVALVSMIMALGALSIDLMLPAFPDIRADFGLAADSTQVSGIISAFLLGLAVGQIPYGPFSDRFGRKPVLYVGFGIYALGAAGAALAPSLPLVLAARFVWGLGAAGPRVLAISMVRDVSEGDRMARTLSFVMAVFILVPILAPSLGALINAVAPWRTLFWFCVVFVMAVGLWALRLPETQDPSDRLELRFDGIARAAREVMKNRTTAGYTLAMTASFGAFVSYLATSEIIVGEVFGRAEIFPIVFGGFAAVMGAAMLGNARIVEKIGSKVLVHRVLLGYVVIASMLVALSVVTDGRPPFILFLVGFAAMLSMHGLLIPNFNTVAMTPMGHVAGTASAIIGTVSTAGGTLLGALFDRTFNSTITPLSIAFFTMGVTALAAVTWAERTAPEVD
jgi:DHA1 family bicyclomycin/chloramphenicol resistance-like MFS transporter